MDFIFSQNNLFILIIALVSGGMLLWPTLMKRQGTASVGVQDAIQLANHRQALFLDVRPAEEFRNGTIPQARNVPAAEVEKKLASLPKNRPVIVVCNHGRDSAKVAATLRAHGLAEAVSLEGGLSNWTKEGLLLSKKG